MKKHIYLDLVRIFLFSLAILFFKQAHAVDDDIVFVNKDCSAINSEQHCFNDFTELRDWLWPIRQPTAASPVTVMIGPGVFGTDDFGSAVAGVRIECSNSGHVSFIGSGPGITVLKTRTNVVRVSNCDNLTFQDFTLDGSEAPYAIDWGGAGKSRWVNVDVIGLWNAWRDRPGANCTDGVHYWFNSRLRSFGANGGTYETKCGESWFYASELTLEPTFRFSPIVVNASNVADIRLFGSVIRLEIPDSGRVPRAVNAIYGVKTTDSAVFHMHGGIISLDASPAVDRDISVIGVRNDSSEVIHTPDTAFALKPSGNGSVLRATASSTGGPVLSPFLWQAGTTPPNLAATHSSGEDLSISSVGNDLFVETDCDSAGDCDTAQSADQRPHLMIFSTTCGISGNSPWFDVARNKCRDEP